MQYSQELQEQLYNFLHLIEKNKKSQQVYLNKLKDAEGEDNISRAFSEYQLQVIIGRFYHTAYLNQLNSTEMDKFSRECFHSGLWAWPGTSEVLEIYKCINFWHDVTIRLTERIKKLN